MMLASSWSWSLLGLAVAPFVLGGFLDVQDNDPGMVYTGLWVADGSPNAHGSHETWTNQTGANVYYDFQGTQVKVYATMRPTGVYLTNVSFVIDNGDPTFWTTTANVTADTFNKLVYTSSASLSPDSIHRISVTNYGRIFWLVYMEITTVDPASASSTVRTTSPSPSPSPTSSSDGRTTSTGPTSLTSPPSSQTSGAASGSVASQSLTSTSGSGTPTSSGSLTNTSSSSSATSADPDSQSSTSETSTRSYGSAWPTESYAYGSSASSSSSRTPMIVGIVVGVVGGVALLIAMFWCMHTRAKAREQRLMDAIAAVPYNSQAAPTSTHWSKERPPTSKPSSGPRRVFEWIAGTQVPASDPGYAGPATPVYSANPRPHSAPPDPEALKQLAILRGKTPLQAQSSTPPTTGGSRPLPTPPSPHVQTQAGHGRTPSVPQTPTSGSSPSPDHNAPQSRSAWLSQALSFSSARHDDPGRTTLASNVSRAPSMASAVPSSPILPAPTYTGSSGHRRALYFRIFGREHDGGVRLAGGSPQDRNANMWTPAEYDEAMMAMSEASTLPPSYQQYSSNPSERR